MKALRYWLPALIWAGGLFLLSALPPIVPGEKKVGFVGLDKWSHLAAYGLLAALILWPLRRHHHLTPSKAALLAAVLAAAYGATDEWHQSFIPYRYCTLGDWTADALGAILLAAVWYLYESRRSAQANR
jgi:VanZ family protein